MLILKEQCDEIRMAFYPVKWFFRPDKSSRTDFPLLKSYVFQNGVLAIEILCTVLASPSKPFWNASLSAPEKLYDRCCSLSLNLACVTRRAGKVVPCACWRDGYGLVQLVYECQNLKLFKWFSILLFHNTVVLALDNI